MLRWDITCFIASFIFSNVIKYLIWQKLLSRNMIFAAVYSDRKDICHRTKYCAQGLWSNNLIFDGKLIAFSVSLD